MENYSVLWQTTRACLGRIRGLKSVETESKDVESVLLRDIESVLLRDIEGVLLKDVMRITKTEGRNLSETEAEAEAHKVMNHGMGRSLMCVLNSTHKVMNHGMGRSFAI